MRVQISRSHGLTVQSAYTLIEECPELTSIRDLEGWERVNKMVSGVMGWLVG